MNLRKINMFLVIGMLVTFLAHAISGSLRLAGAGISPETLSAHLCEGFIGLHVIVTTILTVQTLRARRLSGAGYFRENSTFWARRISGFAVLIPLLAHLYIFMDAPTDPVRLNVFTTGRLISQILLVATLAVHIISNVRPALISFGIRNLRAFAVDILFVLSVILLLFALAFAVYYIRWMAV